MVSEYEGAIANQAIYKISEVTAPENAAADLEKGMNRINYNPKDKYEGREGIANVVKKQEDRQSDLYQDPVKAMIGGNSPKRDIYASLLNYKFLN